ncbi:MAG: S8 family serine peptidase [Pseudomonadota bacterium]
MRIYVAAGGSMISLPDKREPVSVAQDSRSRPMVLVLFAAFVLGVVQSHQVIAQDDALEGTLIRWRSENQSREQIPTALANFYTTLYNTGQLVITATTNDDSKTVEEVLRAEGVFTGPFFPESMDSLMCDINPHICTRELAPADETILEDVSAHLHGYNFSVGNWTYEPGDLVRLPKVQLERYEQFDYGWKNKGETIEGILASREVSCESVGVNCRTAVELLNASQPEVLDANYEGLLVLPISGVSASVRLHHTDDPLDFPKVSPGRKEASFGFIEETKKWDHAEDVALRKLRLNTVTIGDMQLQSSVKDEPHYTRQEQLFELIRHPATNVNWSPQLQWGGTRIAVMDGWVDSSHCDLGPNVTVNNLPNSPVPSPAAASCGSMEAANMFDHHGTHVTASIGASINGKGISGLVSDAQIVTRQIARHRLSNPRYREQVHLQLISFVTMDQAKTINLSWSYTNDPSLGVDPIGEAIRVLQRSAVVVVAAGNQGNDLNQSACVVFPACYAEFDNVITVVGLNRSSSQPGLWAGSNSSSKFHIGAIAEDVLSATSANKYGVLSGTSQAAPQVSAAAAYIWAISAAMFPQGYSTPQRVRARIVYTGDMFPKLKDTAVGGRLNMERALDVTRTRVVLNDGREVFGNLVAMHSIDRRKTLDTVIFGDAISETRFALRHLKRMIRNPAGSGYMVFATAKDGGDPSRFEGLPLKTRRAWLEVETEGGTEFVQFRDIEDYTAKY